MTKAILPDGRQATYKYDAFGRRIKKTVTDKNGHQKTTEFLWQGDNLIAETDNKEHYQSYIYEPNSFKPLALIVGRGKEHKVYHYQLDHIGTPLDLTNTEGKAVWSAQYLAYGTIYTQHTEEVTNPLRFQGQYFDQETGLHYNRHRYYNPKNGLFTTADPIGLAGGLNNYQYVKNPTGWVDPLGLHDKQGNVCPIAMLGKKCYKAFVDDPIKPETLNPQDIHYMQSSIRNTTGDYTVLGNAEALKNGSLKAEQLTKIKVWKDTEGNIWSLDHRRLAAFKESGLDNIPIEWATLDEVKKQAWKMTTKTGGRSIKLKLGGGNNVILGAK